MAETQVQNVEEALRAAYDRAGEAYRSKNADALLSMITPDFQQQMPDGQVLTREFVAAGLQEWLGGPDRVTGYDVRLGAVKVRGQDATVTVDETVKTRFEDESGPHERVQQNSARVTWTSTPQGWKIRRSDYLSGRMTVDGRSVQPLFVD